MTLKIGEYAILKSGNITRFLRTVIVFVRLIATIDGCEKAKQDFKAKIAGIEGQGIEKGYAKAVKEIGNLMKAKSKAVGTLESKFEGAIAKLASAATPKKAKKGNKVRKAPAKRGVAKKVARKTVRRGGKTMKRAAATKAVNVAPA